MGCRYGRRERIPCQPVRIAVPSRSHSVRTTESPPHSVEITESPARSSEEQALKSPSQSRRKTARSEIARVDAWRRQGCDLRLDWGIHGLDNLAATSR